VLNGVTFAVAPGMILGLLGPNGAGKTTTIRCITGEEAPGAGSVSIRSVAGTASLGGPCYIGLCPQETVVNADLTVRENLWFFALVRGVSGAEAECCVASFLKATHLVDKHAALPNALSGGMRRRLAVACAMIGTPSVVILDEPTTGLDPMSRRGIWGAIGDMKAAGSCCLLTTHMMEEAEALCTSLVVLKKGCVAAEGSVQQLKEAWSTGYVLSVDCSAGEDDVAKDYLASILPNGKLELAKLPQQGQMTIKVANDPTAVGHLFLALAREGAANGIRHWGISQASLEDTYLMIVQDDGCSGTEDTLLDIA
jgi:ABC-type multidrug transport system ATPase subunit